MNAAAIAIVIALVCLLILGLAAVGYSFEWALRCAALGRQAAADAGRARELSMSVARAHYGGAHLTAAPEAPPLCCTLCLSAAGHGGLMPRHVDGRGSWQCVDLEACLAAAQAHVLVLGAAGGAS